MARPRGVNRAWHSIFLSLLIKMAGLGPPAPSGRGPRSHISLVSSQPSLSNQNHFCSEAGLYLEKTEQVQLTFRREILLQMESGLTF